MTEGFHFYALENSLLDRPWDARESSHITGHAVSI